MTSFAIREAVDKQDTLHLRVFFAVRVLASSPACDCVQQVLLSIRHVTRQREGATGPRQALPRTHSRMIENTLLQLA